MNSKFIKRYLSFVLAFIMIFSNFSGFSLVVQAEKLENSDENVKEKTTTEAGGEDSSDEEKSSKEDSENKIENELKEKIEVEEEREDSKFSIEIDLTKESIYIDEEIEIIATVKDDDEIVEENILWEIENEEIVEHREEDNKLFVKGIEIGNIVIKAYLESDNEIESKVELEIKAEEKLRSKREVENGVLDKVDFTDEYLDKEIEQALEWTEKNNDEYKFNTVTTLLLLDVNKENIIEKKYSHKSYFGFTDKPKNVISNYLLGTDMEDDYLEAVKNYDLSTEIKSDNDAQSLINTIIALDLLDIEYDEKLAVKMIIKGIKENKIKNDFLGQALIAIADKLDNKEKEIVRDLFISRIGEYKDFKIIGNIESHALALEGLIAIGEDVNSELFQELFKAISASKVNYGYSTMPAEDSSKPGTEVQVLELLLTIKNREDIYSSIAKKDKVENNYSISIDKSKVEFYEDEGLDLNITVKDEEDIIELPYILTSENEDIIKIVDNKIQIIGLGKVKIKAQLKGFSKIIDEIEIEILKKEKQEDINKHIDNTLDYYEKNREKDFSSTLTYEDYTVLAKTDMNLSNWKKSEDIGKDLNTLVAKAQQVELYLSLGKDPRNYKGINLIDEIKIELEKGIKGEKFSQNYLDAVNAFNRFNNIYKVEIEDGLKKIIAENLIYALADDGGFGGGPNDKKSAVPNTGRGLRALSEYRDKDGVNEAIESSVNYLKSMLKEDGRIYDKTYFTYNHTDAVRGLLAVGENLTNNKWRNNGDGPIEAMFLYKQENNSFKQKSDPSIGSDKIATRNVLDTLLLLKDLGYGEYILGGNTIESKPDLKPDEKVLKDYINGIVNYYNTEYFVENQSTLNPREYATLNRLNIDLSRWNKSDEVLSKYDKELNYIGSKADQVDVYLDLNKDPTDFKGRNLIEEMAEQIKEGSNNHSNSSYLKAIIVLNKFNKNYPNKYIEINNEFIVENIEKMQNIDGGILEKNDSVIMNTGLALEVLSNCSGKKTSDLINNAKKYLLNMQKDDGGFYVGTYLTAAHAQVIKGLLAVGEDLRTEKWKKENNGPIEALFINWQDNNSFWNIVDESINNRPWEVATERGLSTLIELSQQGYSNYILKSIPIKDKEEIVSEFLEVETMIVQKQGEIYDQIYKANKIEIDSLKHGGLTALASLKATTPLVEETGGFVTSIAEIEGRGKDGWMYTVNDKAPNVGANKFILTEGDRVLWYYAKESENWYVPSWIEITDGIKIDINYKSELKVGEETNIEFLIKDKDGEAIIDTIELSTEDTSLFEITNNKVKVKDIGQGFGSIDVKFKNLAIIKTIYYTLLENEEKSRLDIDEVIEKVRNNILSNESIDFRASIAYNYTSKNLEEDLKTINNKYKLRTKETVSDLAGNILGIIGAGGNPYNYNGENHVEKLIKLQRSDGLIGDIDTWDNSADSQSFAIYALEASKANYNRDKALNNFLRYGKDNFGGQDSSANALVTLSFFMNDKNLDSEINKIKEYLKANQRENGGIYNKWTGENLYSTFATVQGLIAIGEDPDSEKWSVNGNSLVDFILKRNISDLVDLNFGQDQMLLALGDVKKGKSIYHSLEILKSEPTRIEIEDFKFDKLEVGMKLPLNAKVYDKNNNLLYGQEIIWSVSDSAKAKIMGNTIEFLSDGDIKLTASLKGNANIKTSKSISIFAKSLDINITGDKNITNGSKANLKAEITNNSKDSQSIVFIVALYDEDNRMVKYDYEEKTIGVKEKETLNIGMNIPSSGKFKVKTFVWDNFIDKNIKLENPEIINVNR